MPKPSTAAERVTGREPLPQRREATHTLVVEVPLHIGDGQTLYFDPIQDALRTVLAVSRLATVGLLCGDPQVSINEAALEGEER